MAGAASLTRPAAAHTNDAVDASRGDFSGLVEIDGGRRLYLECRGEGSPTVVLEAGGGDTSDVWTLRLPDSHRTPVMTAVARYTRVCACDRPGTGATLDDVVDVGVLPADPGDFTGMNEEYAVWFLSDPPCRYAAKLGAVIPGVLVSIRMTAVSEPGSADARDSSAANR